MYVLYFINQVYQADFTPNGSTIVVASTDAKAMSLPVNKKSKLDIGIAVLPFSELVPKGTEIKK